MRGRYKYVAGIDIRVHDVVEVRVLHSRRSAFDDLPRKSTIELPPDRSLQQRRDCFTLEPFHHEEEAAVMLVEVEHVDDIRVCEPLRARRFSFQFELRVLPGCDRGAHHLDRDMNLTGSVYMTAPVDGLVHGAHDTGVDDTDDLEAVFQQEARRKQFVFVGRQRARREVSANNLDVIVLGTSEVMVKCLHQHTRDRGRHRVLEFVFGTAARGFANGRRRRLVLVLVRHALSLFCVDSSRQLVCINAPGVTNAFPAG